MTSVLIAFATTHGHTAKVAGRLRLAMGRHGMDVTDHHLRHDDRTDPSAYDSVVVAASLHLGNHQRDAIDWVRANREALRSRPNAFLSVSLAAADDDPESREAVARAVRDFEADTGWAPDVVEPVPGALQYLEYDSFTRQLIRLLRKAGDLERQPRDQSFTDWEAIDDLGAGLARDFESRLRGRSR